MKRLACLLLIVSLLSAGFLGMNQEFEDNSQESIAYAKETKAPKLTKGFLQDIWIQEEGFCCEFGDNIFTYGLDTVLKECEMTKDGIKGINMNSNKEQTISIQILNQDSIQIEGKTAYRSNSKQEKIYSAKMKEKLIGVWKCDDPGSGLNFYILITKTKYGIVEPSTVNTPTIVVTNAPSTDASEDQAETSSQLTTEQKLADFETMYDIIRDNYAFLDVNKRLNGIDWLANKESYEKKVSETKNDDEFYDQLNAILSDLNNWHTSMLDRDAVLDFGSFYKYDSTDTSMWQGLMYEEFCKPEVLKRYHVKVEDYETGNDTYYDGDYSKDNLFVDDIVKGKVAHICIPELIDSAMIGNDEKILKEYLPKVKDYQALVIDIRGNNGGDSDYFQQFLYPLIIPKSYSASTFLFYKDGSYVQKQIDWWGQHGWQAPLIKDLDLSELPNLKPEVARDFTYYDQSLITIDPADDGIKYQGHIYLLVDSEVYSSAEMMAMFTKDSGLATLIGAKTGGDGLGSDPMVSALPNSGYLMRYSVDYGTSMDGSCNEEVKTQPDYVVENPVFTGDPADDECLQKVLELEGLK